ncbi:MAG TPA: helix-turn-helix domain-containing protein [Candidatus Tetragenococcus pullicola]|nr:helix-turn-helix domain-containing protein [Candidatus Tetragenococcus pullicola]
MDDFILDLFAQNDKLKATTVYQILAGKKTSSVLSYAYFHDLLAYFSAFPTLKKDAFFKILKTLKSKGKLRIDENWQMQILDKEDQTNRLSDLKNLDFFRYGKTYENCWRSVQLLVQAVSNLDKTKNYQPIETSPLYTEPVRQVIVENREEISQILYHEMQHLFENISQEKADFLASTLTGFNQNGQVYFQLVSENYQKTPWAQLYFADAIHLFLQELTNQRDFLLYHFLRNLLIANKGQSMLKTLQLSKQGHTMKELVQLRHLKPGTIQDHLIEWSLQDPNFPFDQFISKDQWGKMEKLPKKSWNIPYKKILEKTDLPFLELRLYQIYEKGHKAC